MSVLQLSEQSFDEVVGGSTVPVLVDVTAEWCPPCRAMEPILHELSEDLAGRLVVASVDADAHPDVALRLGVMSFPSLIVFVGGEERARVIGARGKGRMLEALVPFLPVAATHSSPRVLWPPGTGLRAGDRRHGPAAARAKIATMELTPFASLTLGTGSEGFYMLGPTPAGTRIIQEIQSAELVGERVNASLVGTANADWLAIDAQGIGIFDIRLTLKTDDDAILYLAYAGRADWSEGLGRGPIYVGAEFEAGDERYRWLNALHLFGRGGVADGGVRYDFFQGS